MSTLPVSGSSIPAITRTIVVLPAPLRPISPTRLFGGNFAVAGVVSPSDADRSQNGTAGAPLLLGEIYLGKDDAPLVIRDGTIRAGENAQNVLIRSGNRYIDPTRPDVQLPVWTLQPEEHPALLTRLLQLDLTRQRNLPGAAAQPAS